MLRVGVTAQIIAVATVAAAFSLGSSRAYGSTVRVDLQPVGAP